MRINRELFRILAEHIPLVDFGLYKQVIITKGEQVLISPSTCEIQGLAPCNHEEADTRMLVHVSSAAQAGHRKVAIRAVDTDVIVICIDTIQSLLNTELWILYGTDINLKSFAIHEIASTLGPEK